MREVKFRAYEKHLKEIIPVDDIDFKLKQINTDHLWRFFEEIELMQYTGLNDKNGTEIYEGDILQADKTGTFLGDKFYKGFKGYFKVKEVKDIRICFFKNFTDKITVIGNIYENPELTETLGDNRNDVSQINLLNQSRSVTGKKQLK